MKSQSLSMNNITYIYKHIKSGNGRNVFRVCLKILWGNACVSSFQMLLGYINSKNVRYLFEFARRKCGIPKIAIWRYFTDVLVDMSHICGLSSDCLLLMFFLAKIMNPQMSLFLHCHLWGAPGPQVCASHRFAPPWSALQMGRRACDFSGPGPWHHDSWQATKPVCKQARCSESATLLQ
jgi:hypothetical protein